MSALDAEQLRISATQAAAEEIARGHGDDDIDEAITHYLVIYGHDELTLGELRRIAKDAFATATAAAKAQAASRVDEARSR
jgi:hypothetical protein